VPNLPPNMADAVAQLMPGLDVGECTRWLEWVVTQPDYHLDTVGQAHCVTKVYWQVDPPWECMAQEVCWWGYGRDAVRALHRGMDWARLQGAQRYGYSLAPRLTQMTWKTL
jgi:hypothetical protein